MHQARRTISGSSFCQKLKKFALFFIVKRKYRGGEHVKCSKLGHIQAALKIDILCNDS